MTARLDEIEQRAAATTPGPWSYDGIADDDGTDGVEYGHCVLGGGSPGSMKEHQVAWLAESLNLHAPEDAAFIAAARTDVPWLVEQLRDARRCNAIGHPTVTPESLIPCMAERGHDGDHWSASGCAGGTVTWPTVEQQLRDARAENERLKAFARWLIEMDDPASAAGRARRQTITLNRIIDAARALDTEEVTE